MKKTIHFLLFGLIAYFVLLPGLSAASDDIYLIGTGIHDVTGPAAEVGMMGYSMVDQKTAGIHMRLRSRAYIFADDSRRIVYVCADLGMIFQGVKQAVVARLKDRYGDLYTEKNVLLSATHTHSGPGGYSHYATYNLSVLGFIEQNFSAIVSGIYQSIVKAHANLVPGRILFNRGVVENAGWNRSYDAYMNNPADERSLYDAATDKAMTLVKLISTGGEELGMINWFATHPTSLGNTNLLISGDNKGYAEYLFEKDKGTDYLADKTFIAAFAISNAGDVSPNIYWGYPDGVHDFEHMEIIGTRQYQTARGLYDQATEPVTGPIDFRHMFVDLSGVMVDASWVQDSAEDKETCSAAIGFPQIAGSTEDGKGVDLTHEGMAWSDGSWPEFTLLPEDQECQEEKIILLPAGRMLPYPWVPEVLPLQIVRIGSLAIVAMPTEITTMAGRRIMDTVMGELNGTGISKVVIAGLSNAYCSYVTTREEFATQHYEGGSTMFGPYTLNAFQQNLATLARAMRTGDTVPPGPTPRDLSDDQAINLQTGVVFDDKPLGADFGDVETPPNASYSRGETVKVVFWGGHPKNGLQIQGTFLKVEKVNVDEVCHQETVGCDTITVCDEIIELDRIVANDWDPQTVYRWKRDGIANSKVTIEWTIPADASTGTYRIRHFGHWKSGWTGDISPYEGVSPTFEVK